MSKENVNALLVGLLQRPYKREILLTEEGTWFARAPELPGCITEGDTQADAIEMLNDAMESWFSTALEEGIDIPEPTFRDRGYSGRFVLRVPRRLHRQLVEQAEENGVSLNEYCVSLLSEGCGGHEAFRKRSEKRVVEFLDRRIEEISITAGYRTFEDVGMVAKDTPAYATISSKKEGMRKKG